MEKSTFKSVADEYGITKGRIMLWNALLIWGLSLWTISAKIIHSDNFSDNQLDKIEVCIESQEKENILNENNFIDISELTSCVKSDINNTL